MRVIFESEVEIDYGYGYVPDVCENDEITDNAQFLMNEFLEVDVPAESWKLPWVNDECDPS